MKTSNYGELRKITKDILCQLSELEAKVDCLPGLGTYVIAFGLTGCLGGALIGLIIAL